MILTIILAIFLVAVAVLLLGIKVLFVPGSKFPMGHHAHAQTGGCLTRQVMNQSETQKRTKTK